MANEGQEAQVEKRVRKRAAVMREVWEREVSGRIGQESCGCSTD